MASIESVAYIFIITLGLFPGPISGITVTFSTSTNEILPSLTSALDMTCDVNSTTVMTSSTSGSVLVGRDTSNMAEASITYVTSIVVVRDGSQHLASVTGYTPAVAQADSADNLKVKGQITGNEGFLKLSWSYPTEEQLGGYVCEVNGFTSQGHSVVVTKRLEVEMTTPNISVLVEHIGALKKQNDVQQQVNARLQNANDLQDQRLTNLEHVESGIINCGSAGESNPHTWYGRTANDKTVMAEGGTDMYLPKTVHFGKAYPRAPVVHLSTAFVYMDEEDNVYYNVDLVSVSTDSFSMRCRTFLNGFGRINSWTVSWVSIPQ